MAKRKADSCPLCKIDASETYSNDLYLVSCDRCGSFSIDRTSEAILRSKNLTERQIANASGWIKEHREVKLGERDIEFLLTLPSPSVAERADKILTTLGREFPEPGRKIFIDLGNPNSLPWLAVSWSVTPAEVQYLFHEFLSDHFRYLDLKIPANNRRVIDGKITPTGHLHLHELRKVNAESEQGFCAMWFADKVKLAWADAIFPAIEAAGYRPERIDEKEHLNRIDDEIIASIRRSRFVVADFTGQRGGVYFEAGFALGLDLPVIWTVREDDIDLVHFDNRQYNFIVWRMEDLPDFKKRLHNRIEATIGHGTYRPPL